jgi:threonine aldolase
LEAVIDLRSDTVTKPTPEMRAAMAAAEVGDDVYGEDPTVNLLEKRAAEIFGREAALFVATGTMGNQIGIRLHTQPGQEVICESRSHILDWEMATTAVFSGCLIRAVPTETGILTWKDIEPVIYGHGSFRAATGLIEIENTANLAGGRVSDLLTLDEICGQARERKLPVHLDGARIFNAATALGVDVKTLTRGFDTVMFCLSKGLRASGVDAGGFGGVDGAGADLPQGAGRRHETGRRAGRCRADCAGKDDDEIARRPCERAVAGRDAGEHRRRGH